MQNKIALLYHRFSDKDQSHGSLERQAIITGHWCRSNSVIIQDTFNDDGFSAKTFDRPDIKKLFAFIKQQKNKIDYLVVAELTRFSRNLGDAVNMVNKIQKDYGIQIVSSGRNSVYDVKDATSFFMMSIEFTLGNTDNLQRESNINGGIYTAKKEGRYIGSKPPFGYIKQGEGKERKLVIVENEAAIIRFIFSAWLNHMPDAEIKKQAYAKGFKKSGHSVIKDVLNNPIYIGKQRVKAWKDQPGGIMPGIHPAIIDADTWNNVQQRLNAPKKKGITIADEMPLRGVLRCHCGLMLTGAPSKSRNGSYYYYYKCNNKSQHNNISVTKAHEQLQQILSQISLPGPLLDEVKKQSKALLNEEYKEQAKKLATFKKDLQQCNEDLRSLEEKYIRDQVNQETYERWFADLSTKAAKLKKDVEILSISDSALHKQLENTLYGAKDVNFLYNAATTTEKQDLLRKLFKDGLYYQDKNFHYYPIKP